MNHKIRVGTPIPVRNVRNGYAVTLRALQPGQDSFMAGAKAENLRSLIYQMRKRGELVGARFTLRKASGGATVWRLA